ncbi:hypothetical protein NHX12_024528 [Muraenolepis orangiensis]|uniref:Uncharacterized protein n=1 Tax=Muraenolepis orangiensis TaxID=630683 RepID=A0A9Q0EG65_9TELE|nr:hypothetical protein NHX12_024528 [Muraenolepis orangiensis]
MKTDRERRRAVSREAARSRRKKEADVFADLSHLLPLPPDLLAHLDKPSVLRLTISYMRTSTLLITAELRSWGLTQGEADLYLGVSGGFLMVLSAKGDMVFLSDNVSEHIGLTPVDLIGHRGHGWSLERDFFVRMKSTLTLRGRTTNIKSAPWKVLHCEGRLKPQHCLDLRFTHCNHRVRALLGYSPEELLGCSLYQLCHMLDINLLARSHLNRESSSQYRMLVRGGGYVWAESHSALRRATCSPKVPSVYSQCSSLPPCIFSITYILSGVLEPSLQLSLDQSDLRHVT